MGNSTHPSHSGLCLIPTHTHSCTTHLFLAHVSLITAEFLLPATLYCPNRNLFSYQSKGKNALLSFTEFRLMKTDFLGSYLKMQLSTVMGTIKPNQNPQTYCTVDSSATMTTPTHLSNLCSLLAWHSKSIDIQLLHTFFYWWECFIYVFQAQIQNQMQKEGGNFPNFAIKRTTSGWEERGRNQAPKDV